MIPFCLNNRQFTSSQVGNFPAGMNYSLGKVRPGYTIFLVICLCTMCMLSHFSHVWLCATPWTVAHQPPLSMGFFRQEYWNGLLFPPPGDFPDPGTEPVSPMSPALQVDSLPLSHLGSPLVAWLYLNNNSALCTQSWPWLQNKHKTIFNVQ